MSGTIFRETNSGNISAQFPRSPMDNASPLFFASIAYILHEVRKKKVGPHLKTDAKSKKDSEAGGGGWFIIIFSIILIVLIYRFVLNP